MDGFLFVVFIMGLYFVTLRMFIKMDEQEKQELGL